MVAMMSALAGLAGWALLAVLERFTQRARAIWIGIALVVLVLSLGGPLSADGTSGALGALTAMHLACGAILIPVLSRPR